MPGSQTCQTGGPDPLRDLGPVDVGDVETSKTLRTLVPLTFSTMHPLGDIINVPLRREGTSKSIPVLRHRLSHRSKLCAAQIVAVFVGKGHRYFCHLLYIMPSAGGLPGPCRGHTYFKCGSGLHLSSFPTNTIHGVELVDHQYFAPSFSLAHYTTSRWGSANVNCRARS